MIARYLVTTAVGDVDSTVVEPADGCEARHQGVEVLEFVFRNSVQQGTVEQFADIHSRGSGGAHS